jgi:glycosyltransferase involved in cell wall biosynthesis
MGGVKVVHEYANRLAHKGHDVTIVYPVITCSNPFIGGLRRVVKQVYDKITNVAAELYYTPDSRVTVLVIKKARSKYVPDGDAVVAVGWQTAAWVNRLPDCHGKKFYFLQHFETYFRSKKKVLETFRMPLTKIAIARWIINKLEELGETALGPLGNAIDPEEFYLEANIKNRPNDVVVIYHHMNVKGPKDIIAILKQLKKRQNISAVLVSSRKPVHRIPSWVKIVIRPSLKELRTLYNSSKIFMHTSHSEGWGLPVMEAMACGCAVAAYANEGVSEFLTDKQNALLAEVGNTIELTLNIIRLLENNQLGELLVENGLKTIEKYTWNNCINKLDRILNNP